MNYPQWLDTIWYIDIMLPLFVVLAVIFTAGFRELLKTFTFAKRHIIYLSFSWAVLTILVLYQLGVFFDTGFSDFRRLAYFFIYNNQLIFEFVVYLIFFGLITTFNIYLAIAWKKTLKENDPESSAACQKLGLVFLNESEFKEYRKSIFINFAFICFLTLLISAGIIFILYSAWWLVLRMANQFIVIVVLVALANILFFYFSRIWKLLLSEVWS